MARIIEEKKIINSHISNYIDTVTDFSKYLEGTPTFSRYYSKDVTASTSDVGLQNVNQNIGNESPLKYNLIRNFPLYNMEEASISNDYDEETGTNTDIELTAIVLPDCGIRPLVGDFFACTSIKKNMELFFKVQEVEIGNINDRTLYKITAHFASPDESEAYIQDQVNSIYETLYDNIGQNSKAGKIVVKEDVFERIEKLKEKKEEIKKYYELNFYNKDLNTFVYSDGDYVLYYDNLLMKFIQKNKLFIENKTFLKNIYIEPLFRFDGKENKLYTNSIYNYIEREDPSKKYYEHLLDSTFYLNNQKYSIFNIYNYLYPASKEIVHFPTKQVEETEVLKILLDRNNQPVTSTNQRILMDKDNQIIREINGQLVVVKQNEIILIKELVKKPITKDLITKFTFKYMIDLFMNKYGLQCPVCGRCDIHSHVVNFPTFQMLKASYRDFNSNPDFKDYRMKYNENERADVIVVSRKNNIDDNLFTFFGPDKRGEVVLGASEQIPSNIETGKIIKKNEKYYMYVLANNGKKVLVNVEGANENQFDKWQIAANTTFNNKVKYLDVLMNSILDYELYDADREEYMLLPIVIYLINKLIREYEINL